MTAHPLSASCICLGCRSAIADGYRPVGVGLFPESGAEPSPLPREIAAEPVSNDPFALEFSPAIPGRAAEQLAFDGLTGSEPVTVPVDDHQPQLF